MDGRRFDSLARALAGASTRRAALAGSVAALLPLAAPARPGRGPGGPSPAACLAAGQRCGKGGRGNGKPCRACCSRHAVAQGNGTRRCACKPAGIPAANAAQCCSGRRSAGGFCGACDPGLTECNGGCADLRTDGANCGACGAACGPCATCRDGACVAANEGEACADGRVCRLGACAGNGACGPGTANRTGCGPASCGGSIPSEDARSICKATAEGGLVCAGRFFAGEAIDAFPACDASGGCAASHACIDQPGDGGRRCFPLCGPRA